MSHRWRTVAVLILVLTMPFRAVAAGAMPCCPSSIESDGPAATDRSTDDCGDATHDGSSHPTFDCCAVAMIAWPVFVEPPRYVPPRAEPAPSAPTARFVADPLERPPRGSTATV